MKWRSLDKISHCHECVPFNSFSWTVKKGPTWRAGRREFPLHPAPSPVPRAGDQAADLLVFMVRSSGVCKLSGPLFSSAGSFQNRALCLQKRLGLLPAREVPFSALGPQLCVLKCWAEGCWESLWEPAVCCPLVAKGLEALALPVHLPASSNLGPLTLSAEKTNTSPVKEKVLRTWPVEST
ncbi:Hypothetical predicted protein [Marmota monax]|uniref:Uncharacterized protein n=1 Tax=Marmota monax TaxID=9995 RepID=A0A5E4BVP3_MARMO|nr:hypothetical protein GHT09_010409 [Marmota monax]VTJ73687.1 Hypothetical predicted protein [Marmota monax]